MEFERLLDGLRALCARLPGSEEYVMVHHPAFRVGKKPFLVAGIGTVGKEPTMAINHGLMAQAEFLEDKRFSRTPYIGKHGWVTIHFDDTNWDEVASLVEGSWRRVVSKKLLLLRPSA